MVPLRMYAGKPMKLPNVSREWTDAEVRKASKGVYGNVISEYIEKSTEHFGGPVPTLVFSADIEHGKELCAGASMRPG